MFTKKSLDQLILSKRTVLCVGLDTDPMKIPPCITGTLQQRVLEFNQKIIHATAPRCVAFKINTAFYEAMGHEGWYILMKTALYIKEQYPSAFLIADAKRADIGNTSEKYARAFLEEMPFDAITASPYMGIDSIQPFFKEGKYIILLALTSNKGALDFQLQPMADGRPLYQHVLQKFSAHYDEDKLMFVAGATHGEILKVIRSMVPEHYLLVPGVGAQGGDLSLTLQAGINSAGAGLLINSSREILYASNAENFWEAAAIVSEKYGI